MLVMIIGPGLGNVNSLLVNNRDEFESGWDPSWITPEQAAGMLELLRSRYENPIGLELLRELEKRANAKASA